MLLLYFYSLIVGLNVIVSLSIGITIPILYLLDDLLIKPIDLIGWTIKKEKTK